MATHKSKWCGGSTIPMLNITDLEAGCWMNEWEGKRKKGYKPE
jgi:hypothetical protein